MDLSKKPDIAVIEGQGGSDAAVSFVQKNDFLEVYLEAKTERPTFLKMRWNNPIQEPVSILGDQWERLQANAAFGPLNAERYLPWYFLIKHHGYIECGGVKVRPNAFVSFSIDQSGVNAYFDVRNGGNGVRLAGRKLHVADLLSKKYEGKNSFMALQDFLSCLCQDPLLPPAPVYGGNDWYAAYGTSTANDIYQDARLIAELTKGLANRPYMVIDDGWEKGNVSGPWEANDKFPDMKGLVQKIRALDVKAGLWIRFLYDPSFGKDHPEFILRKPVGSLQALDPSRPEVLAKIRQEIRQIKDWGFLLIKHDYSAYDIFNRWGISMNGSVLGDERWSFADESKTSAEIIKDFYRTIKEEAGDCLVMGCNVFSHLSAGYVEINRVGDDTSGYVWDRTRSFGVNSLAFRLPQNHRFYSCDADCVGLRPDIPWEMNKQWADLLSRSGTPLFLSCKAGWLSASQKAFLSECFRRNSLQKERAEPLDWEYNVDPSFWRFDEKEIHYYWQKDIPHLLLTDLQQPHRFPESEAPTK